MKNLTENNFRKLLKSFGNGCERYENGEKTTIYQLYTIIDNKFNLSYHLYFPQKKVKFNFWFKKLSYLNAKERVIISYSCGNGVENILTTCFLDELENKINQIMNKNK